MNKIRLDFAAASRFVDAKRVKQLYEKLPGLKLEPELLRQVVQPDERTYLQIMASAQAIQQESEALLVLGVGGSQGGAKAFIEALNPKAMPVYFAGHSFSGHYLKALLEKLEHKDVSVIVISKSGNTAETLLSFGVVRSWMQDKYDVEAPRRIYAVTGKKNNGGALGNIAAGEKYNRFYIPEGVGGRYSLFTAVGLLPMAAAGINIDEILAGAQEGLKEYGITISEESPVTSYALWRTALYHAGYANELWVTYEPCLNGFGNWWRQLYVESESKEGHGIYPVVAEYTNDLHFLGQYMREGPRNIFESILWLEEAPTRLPTHPDTATMIGWGDVSNMAAVIKKVMEQTASAHNEAGVPQLKLFLPKLSAFYLAKLAVYFATACLISSGLQGIDPLNQPGVEEYKQQVRQILK
ncbi:MAG: glucose-6-phosphate isomerase [Clostridia bacterium]|jgi:glucose-6-phosphate isomerase|nr:glucose-6-phosphate isomerase [Clostridia bacterium]